MSEYHVQLPDNFVPIKYPGYYWDIEGKKLYSLKTFGCLKALTHQPARRFHFRNSFGKMEYMERLAGYSISHHGKRHVVSDMYLARLGSLKENYTIEMV
jgi:hypothetical protein